MTVTSSSCSGSRSCRAATPPVVVRRKPQETPLGRRRLGGNLIINEGRHPSPPRGCLRLVKLKKEPVATIIMKKEHAAVATDLEAGLRWSCDDYMWVEMAMGRVWSGWR
ncbi:hypothetical protein D1007_33697 [Hordeum vulgare]|nr:hypothetical protein D1007_33697 [Hordeum vulgare]